MDSDTERTLNWQGDESVLMYVFLWEYYNTILSWLAVFKSQFHSRYTLGKNIEVRCFII